MNVSKAKPAARPKRRRAPTDPIERVNRKSDAAFVAEHLLLRQRTAESSSNPESGRSSKGGWTPQWTHPRPPHTQYRLGLVGAKNVSAADLRACFDLIEETSRKDYEPSSFGWKPARKLEEMRSPDLRYILVKTAKEDDEAEGDEGKDAASTGSASGSLCGFASLMPTYEDGQPVVYCYEIHLKPELQGTGMGRMLMGFLEDVAASSPPITKVMLTCFLSNQHAFDFYKKLGFEVDEISPGPRKLRHGRVFVPDYAIMSKVVSRRESASSDSMGQES